MALGVTVLEKMAGTTRLELATSAVTGQRSNRLNYVPSNEITESEVGWFLWWCQIRPVLVTMERCYELANFKKLYLLDP